MSSVGGSVGHGDAVGSGLVTMIGGKVGTTATAMVDGGDGDRVAVGAIGIEAGAGVDVIVGVYGTGLFAPQAISSGDTIKINHRFEGFTFASLMQTSEVCETSEVQEHSSPPAPLRQVI